MQDEPDHVPYRERPAYPYPDYTRYKGNGDPNLASSYKRITLDRE